MKKRPETWLECWRYARTIGYPRTMQGWLLAYKDLVRAAHLPWGVRRTPVSELQKEVVSH